MVYPHRPAAPSRPARAVRRTHPFTRILAVGIFCALTYTGLTAGAFGPASDLAEALRIIWTGRGDRYSDLRTLETVDLPRVEMSFIGG